MLGKWQFKSKVAAILFAPAVVLLVYACGGIVTETKTENQTENTTPTSSGPNCTLTVCGDSCVDVNSNNNNCGSCGHACPSGEVCDNGLCEWDCSSDKTSCASGCADLQTDENNCGACGDACAAGETCTDGACVVTGPTCASGETNCSGTCVDTQTDNNNCSTCGNACASGFICEAGLCKEITIAPITIPIPTFCFTPYGMCSGVCVNLDTDPDNCGTCGKKCSWFFPMCCGGRCVATSTSCP